MTEFNPAPTTPWPADGAKIGDYELAIPLAMKPHPRKRGRPPKSTNRKKNQHVVLFSGGIGSYCAALRVKERFGTENLNLLFTDTMVEDPDLYRFLVEAAADIGAPLYWICEGRTIWEVFRDYKIVPNRRLDICSAILKRNYGRKFINQHFDPEGTTIYIGIDWSEENRYHQTKQHWTPYDIRAPLISRPLLTKTQMANIVAERGIEPPRLYAEGFPHNNCGGGCIKAGIGWFKHLMQARPETYELWENNEKYLRELANRDAGFIVKYPNKQMTVVTLEQLRQDTEPNPDDDWGGCGCAIDGDTPEVAALLEQGEFKFEQEEIA